MWWLTDQRRLQTERQAIEALDADWFQHSNWSVDGAFRLMLTFDLALARGRFPLRLTYHHTFPASPPSIHPADGEARLSGHQYGLGGDLCLDIRNDNWTPDVTGADMISSARRLLEAETPSEDGATVHAPSAHDFPNVLHLRSAVTRFYLDPLAYVALAGEGVDGLPIEVGFVYQHGMTLMAHLLSIGAGDAGKESVMTPAAIRESSVVHNGVVFDTDVPTPELQQIRKLGTLRELLSPRLMLRDDESWAALLRGSEGDLTLLCHFADNDDLRHYTTVASSFEPSRSGITVSDLGEKRVGLVGLGSLGSKVAISLARIGVRRFELVDGDILHAGNLERYDGDWRDVGRHKVDLVAHRLELIHRDVDTQPWPSAIGAQVSSQEAANVSHSLAACDLLIDATANPDVFNHLASLSIRYDCTLVWGAVFAGGVGGEIARARIGKDPSPYDIRAGMNQSYSRNDESLPVATGHGYDGSVGDPVPIQATDADVSVFAAHLADLAFDALIDAEPSKYEAHAYLLGLKRAWLFDGVFDALPIIVEAPIRHTLSSGEMSTVESEFIQSLFKGASVETEDTERAD